MLLRNNLTSDHTLVSYAKTHGKWTNNQEMQESIEQSLEDYGETRGTMGQVFLGRK